jgi:hypothetical protein
MSEIKIHSAFVKVGIGSVQGPFSRAEMSFLFLIADHSANESTYTCNTERRKTMREKGKVLKNIERQFFYCHDIVFHFQLEKMRQTQ